MPRKALRPLLAAILVSLFAHLFMFASAGTFWPQMSAEIDFPIEASLVIPAQTPEPDPIAPTPPPSAPAKVVEPATEAPPVASPEPAPAPEALPIIPESLVTSEIPPVAIAPTEPPGPPPTQSTPEPVKPSSPLRKVVRELPKSAEIRYAVQMGEDGFVAGEARYIWHQQKGRYSLVSTVEATGLTALFISGRIVQVSEGQLDPQEGLRPEQYRLQKSERKEDSARFYWAQNRLEHGNNRGTFDLVPQAQDLLSFPFHLALTARENEADFLLNVTNGRKFKEYGVRILGRESFKLNGRLIDALHLQGTREKDGTLDVWLDTARSGLPVKIRTQDQKGKTMVLIAVSLNATN